LEDAAVQAVRAGCDMLLLEEAAVAEHAQTALGAARESGELPGSRVEQALKRIQLAKQGLKLPPATLPKRSLDRIAKEFIDFSSEFKAAEKGTVIRPATSCKGRACSTRLVKDSGSLGWQ